ncbi:PDDEXK nuclease domain-containing protein [Sphingobacterium athyrii]|uniref:PDDEXK nuclease domain-containing protein n=1 Tax=Sphingobacterium athyrii TaxID=2152717 RepID=UPI0035E4025D
MNKAFKYSYVSDFLNLPEPYSEGELQKGLLRQMKDFILELGGDFSRAGYGDFIVSGLSKFFNLPIPAIHRVFLSVGLKPVG